MAKKVTKKTKKKVVAPTTSTTQSLDFTFYKYLRRFYLENKSQIFKHYRDLTKKFLDYNDPARAGSFLRVPQFEALEMYIFLKEFLDNAHVHELFKGWYEGSGKFEGRTFTGDVLDQDDFLAGKFDEDSYKEIFASMKRNNRLYTNYIFALTMGTGKTILMAATIFYEFILANKFPKDSKYCHNAIVFAPDKTVLQSLKEIQTFDLSKVVPPEYVNFLTAHLNFHFLDDTSTSIGSADGSRFNIVISNTQKILLKKKHKEKTAVDKLYGSGAQTFTVSTVYGENADLYDFGMPENEIEVNENARFEKIARLPQLGVYVDEAHHLFGDSLAKDMGVKQAPNSLRMTIDELAVSLAKVGSKVVACFNFTGTPYVGNKILPEVVYGYGLKEAIDSGYLKQVDIEGFSNVRSIDFIKLIIKDFVENYSNQRFEGMLPKLAIYAATVEELTEEVKPAVERELRKYDIPASKILVNVGDDSVTSNDDIRRFNLLDTKQSEDQFILLVNKGKEGWNCRSLFSVGLYRAPRSKIFVLQATMRCLRAITDGQQKARVYLSQENKEILNSELQQNFKISADDLAKRNSDKKTIEVRPNPPPVKIKLQRKLTQFELKEKKIGNGIDLELSKFDKEKYRLIRTTQKGLVEGTDATVPDLTQDLTHLKEKIDFSEMTLVAEVSRYLNKNPLFIENVLEKSTDGIKKILSGVNEFNEILYDWIIPKLFKEFYDLKENSKTEEHEVELIRQPPIGVGYYAVTASPDKIVSVNDDDVKPYKKKSFHLDNYCFDSNPEKRLFWDLLRDEKVKSIYFTGMLTHGQSDFYIQYIDPELHTVRSYYPDFVFIDQDGKYVIVEVKGDDKWDDAVVLSKKAYAEQLADNSGMRYEMIKGSEVNDGQYRKLLS